MLYNSETLKYVVSLFLALDLRSALFTAGMLALLRWLTRGDSTSQRKAGAAIVCKQAALPRTALHNIHRQSMLGCACRLPPSSVAPPTRRTTLLHPYRQ